MSSPLGDGVIAYNFAGMDTLSGDIRSHFTKLGALADTLKAEVDKLGSHWTSVEGANAYRTAQGQWDSAFTEARQRLSGLGQGVENAAVTMRNADMRVRDTFTV